MLMLFFLYCRRDVSRFLPFFNTVISYIKYMNIYMDIILICLSIDINGLRTYTVQYISSTVLYRAREQHLL